MNNNIFFKSDIKRKPLRVHEGFLPKPAETESEQKGVSKEVLASQEAFARYTKNINAMKRAFFAVVQQYAMIVNVYKKRASYLKMDMDVSNADQGLAQAIIAVYNEPVDTIDYDDYISLIVMEANIAAATVAQIMPQAQLSTPQQIATQAAAVANPATQAITTIVKAYEKFVTASGNHEMLGVKIALNGISASNSAIHAMDALDLEGKTESKPESEPERLSKFEQLLKDCFNCAYRNLIPSFDFSKSQPMLDFYNVFYAKLMQEIDRLTYFKASLIPGGYISSMCGVASQLMQFVCIPDLVAILALIKTIIFRIEMVLKDKLDITFPSVSIESLISISVDSLYTTIIKYSIGPFGAIDCIISDLERLTAKIGAVDNYYEQFSGYVDTQKSDFNSILRRGKKEIESYLKSIINDIYKLVGVKNTDSRDIIDLFSYLGEVRGTLGIVSEIIAARNKYKGVQFSSMNIDAMVKAICGSAYSRNPWNKVVVIPPKALPPGASAIGVKAPVRVDNPEEGGSGGGGTVGGGTNPPPGEDIIAIIDETIGDDFFDDDDLFEAVNDIDFEDPSETGEYPSEILDAFQAGFTAMESYKARRERSLLERDAVQASNPESSTGVPIIYFDFRTCLRPAGEVTQEQINNWINKLEKY